MTSTFRFGRSAGIEIGAHWSWLLVVALVIWSLAATVFPATTPDLTTATHVAMALVAAALFFASLLAHELGHALQARRDGVPIDGITLRALVLDRGRLAGLLSITDAARVLEALIDARAPGPHPAPPRVGAHQDPVEVAVAR